MPALVELYVGIGRMRILFSPKVVESAELVARRIVDSYLTPNKTFLELREMVNSGRSIFFAISAKPAARSSNRFAANSDEEAHALCRSQPGHASERKKCCPFLRIARAQASWMVWTEAPFGVHQ